VRNLELHIEKILTQTARSPAWLPSM